MTEKFPRTDSTQAMKSIFSAYGDDEEAVEEPPQAPSEDYLMEGNISGSDDEDSTTRFVFTKYDALSNLWGHLS